MTRARTPKLLYVFLVLPLLYCSDRDRSNPFDPQNPTTEGRPTGLRVVAGDRKVDLSWDFSSFFDITGYNIYRRKEGEGNSQKITPKPFSRESVSFTDEDVVNGETYLYSISVLVEGSGESSISVEEQATPGPEVGWIADRSAGRVYKISPDGRDIILEVSDLREPVSLSVDRTDHSCWVADRFSGEIRQITSQGNFGARFEGVRLPSDIRIDSQGGLCWVISSGERKVIWVELHQFRQGSPLDNITFNVVDANFDDPTDLSPLEGLCWISDRAAGRVIKYPVSGANPVIFPDIDSPSDVASDERSGDCWVVVNGFRIDRLSSEGDSVLAVTDTLDAVKAIDVVASTGEIWAIGGTAIYKFDGDGELNIAVEGFSSASALAVNDTDGSCWVISRIRLWKISSDGEILSSLGGQFFNLIDVAVDPGRGE